MAHQKESKTPRATRESVTGKPSTGQDRKMANVSSEADPIPERTKSLTTRRDETGSQSGGRIQRLTSAIRALFGRNRAGNDVEMPITSTPETSAAPRSIAPGHGRVTRRESDIPMDALANSYTPTQTSLKGGFRDDGNDRHKDQEFATGAGDTGWNDEDHYTNKSNDPRIGTHGRTYEPGETRDESRK